MTGLSRETPAVRAARAGIFLNLVVVLAGLAALAALAWMLFLPALIARAVEARTGFGVRIERLAVNPFTARVALTGLALDNPAAYPSRDFIQVRAFRADAQLFTLFGRRAVFDDVSVDVALVAVFKNVDGTTNVDLFRSRLAGAGGPTATDGPPPARPPHRAEFLIKRLDVRFDRLQLTDLGQPRASSRQLTLGFTHSYTNISDPAQLLVPALFRRIGESGGALEGLLPTRLGVPRIDGDGLLREASRKTSDGLKSLFRALEDSRKP